MHNVRPTIWHPRRWMEGNVSVLVLVRGSRILCSALDEKEFQMSAMSNYYLDLQIEAIRYLASQGIDEESLWDAAEDSYSLVIGLAELHRNNVDIDTIKRIVSEVKL